MTVSAVPVRNGEEIQTALRSFVAKWRNYAGTERSEAQTYLNELFACYGSDRQSVGAKFEDFKALAGFMDLHWPEICIFEMKAPSRAKTLSQAREQVMKYWQMSADSAHDRRAARYVVLCAFQRFEIWEPGGYPNEPRLSFDIEELPDRYESLLFLAPANLPPSFADHYRELTTEAASTIAALYQSLKDRGAAPLDEVQRFIMQAVWAMFAEDLGMLEGFPLQNLVDVLRKDLTRSSATELGYLFRLLNQKGNHNRVGLFKGTRYVNGDLFRQAAEVNLNAAELGMLADAAAHDWRKVNPTIFGSLMEGVLGHARRWELGAHYTHEVDILKIVEPTIVKPWQRRVNACATASEARELLDELCTFKVLDPALRMRQLPVHRLPRAPLAGAPAQAPHQDPRRRAGHTRAEGPAPVLSVEQPARPGDRTDRRPDRPGDPVDGAPADDRPVRRGRGGTAPGRPVRNSGRRCLEHRLAGHRLHRRQPPVPRGVSPAGGVRQRLRAMAPTCIRGRSQGLLRLLVP